MRHYSLIITVCIVLFTACQKRNFCPDLKSTGEVHDFDGKGKSRMKKNGLVKKKQSKRLSK